MCVSVSVSVGGGGGGGGGGPSSVIREVREARTGGSSAS